MTNITANIEASISERTSRRQFLMASLTMSAGILLPKSALALQMETSLSHRELVPNEMVNFWDEPRELWIARKQTGEEVKLCYWKNGRVDLDGYIKACSMLRDVQAGQSVQMDIGLLNILRAMQGWLVYCNIQEPIVVNSGLRVQSTNRKTEGAAKNSMHLYGKAADIVIPGIPTAYLYKLASYFNRGGIGFYKNKQFVHIDTGLHRHWAG